MFKKLEIYGVNKEYLISDDGKIFDVNRKHKYRKCTETKEDITRCLFMYLVSTKDFLSIVLF